MTDELEALRREVAALRASEARYRAVVTDQSEFICRFEPGGRITFVNEALRRATGRTLDDLVGQDVFLFLPEPDRTRLRAHLASLTPASPIGSLEHRAEPQPGEVRWHQWTNRAICDEQGRIVEFQGVGRDITARKRMEDALRESEQRFSRAFHLAPVAIAITRRKDGVFLDANESFVELLGYRREELVGHSAIELGMWPQIEDRTRLLESLRDHGTIRGMEARLRAKSGAIRRVLSSVEEIELAGETVLLGMSVDITDRTRAQEALHRTEREKQAILDSMSEVVEYLDPGMRILWANRAVAQSVRRSLDDLVGHHCYEIWHGRQEPCPGCPVVKALRTGEPQEGEIASPDGRFWIVRGYPVRDAGGQIVGAVDLGLDISDRRRAELALRESEEKFRTLSEEITDGVAIVIGGTNRWVNRAFCELFGYAKDELVGQGEHLVIVPEEVPRLEAYERDRLAGRPAPTRYETIARRKDGRRIHMDVIAQVITFENQKAVQIVVRDVTERRKLEEELLNARKLESIGLLAGGIAHDFGNLLAGVMTHLAKVERTLDDPARALDALAHAENAVLRAKALTQQLLTFSRGGAPLRKPTPVPDLLRETVALALTGSDVRAHFDLPDGLWPAHVDAAQIAQVIQNLTLNAAQAMPGGGTLEIRACNLDLGQPPSPCGDSSFVIRHSLSLPLPPGRYVRVSLTDHGVGIPAEHLPRVFDPYFTTKDTGSGLGLAISYSILKKHDGHIAVASTPGVGTTFDVYLPAAGPEAPCGVRSAECRVAEQEPGYTKPGATGKTRAARILLMDDEELVRKGAAWLLRDAGHHVACAADGAQAIALARQALAAGQPFDAAVLDLIVPGGMGGRECLAALRALDPRVKAIACSGYASEPVLADFQAYGFDAVLSKPFELEDLLATLRALLQEKGGSQSSSSSSS